MRTCVLSYGLDPGWCKKFYGRHCALRSRYATSPNSVPCSGSSHSRCTDPIVESAFGACSHKPFAGSSGSISQTAGATVDAGSASLLISADSLDLAGPAGSLHGTGGVVLAPASGYDGYGKSFDFSQIRITRDLHCFNLYATYDGQRQELRFDLAIKAFPFADTRFGRNQFSEGFDPFVGDVH